MGNEEIYRLINEPDIKRLLNILRCRPFIEKTVLAKELKISFQTLTKQIEMLKEKNVLLKENRIEINPKAYYSCGISIGGAQCKVTFVDPMNKVISAETFNELRKKADILNQPFFENKDSDKDVGYRYFVTPDNMMDLTKWLNEIIKDIIKLQDMSLQDTSVVPVLSIGIALTGSIDAQKQRILKSHNIGYLKNIKQEMLVFPDVLQSLREREIILIMDHNAKALAVCEKFSLYHLDNSNKKYQNKRNIASFYLGSGISTGLILDNRLERGCRNLNGELGHIVVPRYPELQGKELKDERCTCGACGCLEQYIISDGFDMTREEFKSITSEKLKESFLELSEEKYVEKLKILGYYIGWAIDMSVKLLNVDLIIFSGKITCIMDELWSYISYPTCDIEEGLLDCSKIKSK